MFATKKWKAWVVITTSSFIPYMIVTFLHCSIGEWSLVSSPIASHIFPKEMYLSIGSLSLAYQSSNLDFPSNFFRIFILENHRYDLSWEVKCMLYCKTPTLIGKPNGLVLRFGVTTVKNQPTKNFPWTLSPLLIFGDLCVPFLLTSIPVPFPPISPPRCCNLVFHLTALLRQLLQKANCICFQLAFNCTSDAEMHILG